MVAAARRCFARDGFHQTSMPDIAAEAGLSPGGFYRYFPSKDDIVLEVAAQAFGAVFAPVEDLLDDPRPSSVADLVAATVRPLAERDTTIDGAGAVVPVEEMVRCAVQTWSELLRCPSMQGRASLAVERTRQRLAEVLRRGIEAGTVPARLDPDEGARVIIALMHGFLLQRVAFGVDDTESADRFVAAACHLMV